MTELLRVYEYYYVVCWVCCSMKMPTMIQKYYTICIEDQSKLAIAVGRIPSMSTASCLVVRKFEQPTIPVVLHLEVHGIHLLGVLIMTIQAQLHHASTCVPRP